MTVVKVGGSLYDLPDLKTRLTTFFATLNDEICLIPGGGTMVDVIREWDRIHGLGEETSHWLAIRAMDIAGVFLKALLASTHAGVSGWSILHIESWMRGHDALPHSWSVTSDSIAAFVAKTLKADRLVLLKSANVGDEIVDEYFKVICQDMHCIVDIINMRDFERSFFEK